MVTFDFAHGDDHPLDSEVEIWLSIAGINVLAPLRSRFAPPRARGSGSIASPIDFAIWGMVALRQAWATGRGSLLELDGGVILFERRDNLILVHPLGHSRTEPPVVVGIDGPTLMRVWRDFADRLRAELAARHPELLVDPEWRCLDEDPNPPPSHWPGHSTCFDHVTAIEPTEPTPAATASRY